MIQELVLSDSTRTYLNDYAKYPAQAVLIIAPAGMGKGTLAMRMAAGALGIRANTLDTYRYLYRVISAKDAASISIDAIRSVRTFLQLKTVGTTPIRRAVIIEHADTMTTEAQNAFLKILEEPPADTILLLTASNQRAVLPTILSRVQTTSVQPPDQAAVRAYFMQQGHDDTAITQASFLSGGMPGLMNNLLQDTSHPLLQSIATAKQLLSASTFERLAMVERLSKQRDEALRVIESLVTVAHTMLEQNAAKGASGQIKRWHHILKAADQARAELLQSGNIKLVLANTMLQM